MYIYTSYNISQILLNYHRLYSCSFQHFEIFENKKCVLLHIDDKSTLLENIILFFKLKTDFLTKTLNGSIIRCTNAVDMLIRHSSPSKILKNSIVSNLHTPQGLLVKHKPK